MHTNRAAESDDVVFEALSFLPRDLIDDLYFVSKCFQRTIAHHENLLPRRRVESVVLTESTLIGLGKWCSMDITIKRMNGEMALVSFHQRSKARILCEFVNLLRNSYIIKRCDVHVSLVSSNVSMLKHSLKFLEDPAQTCRIEQLDASNNADETYSWAEILRVEHAETSKENDDDDAPKRTRGTNSESSLVQRLHASRFLKRSPVQGPMPSLKDANWP